MTENPLGQGLSQRADINKIKKQNTTIVPTVKELLANFKIKIIKYTV